MIPHLKLWSLNDTLILGFVSPDKIVYSHGYLLQMAIENDCIIITRFSYVRSDFPKTTNDRFVVVVIDD